MQEYQPQEKKEALKETVEMHAPMAVKQRDEESTLDDVIADSYFARELDELRELVAPGKDGDRGELGVSGEVQPPRLFEMREA